MSKDLNTKPETSADDFRAALDTIIGVMYEPIEFYDRETGELIETNDLNLQSSLRGMLSSICWNLERGTIHSELDYDLFSDINKAAVNNGDEISIRQAAYYEKMHNQHEVSHFKHVELANVAKEVFEDAFETPYTTKKPIDASEWKLAKVREIRARHSAILGEPTPDDLRPLSGKLLDLANRNKNKNLRKASTGFSRWIQGMFRAKEEA